MRAFIVVLCAALLLGAEPEPSAAPNEVAASPSPLVTVEPPSLAPAPAPSVKPSATPTPNPYAILAKAREIFHAHVRPPYVVYTLERREWVDDFPDVENSYTWRIWCRTRDSAALSRDFYRRRNRTFFGLRFIRPTLNEAVDPGPPTVDVFPFAPPPTPKPMPTGTERLRTIAIVAASTDSDYRATFAGIDHGAYHLKLEPVRDRDRNRLRELWLDVASLELRRAVAVDRLFLVNEGIVVPDRLDIQFELHETVPVLHQIRAVTNIPPSISRLGRREESEYLYDDIVFASTLPDWYFEPKTYREHFRDAPLR
jgi:hypothetical protein